MNRANDPNPSGAAAAATSMGRNRASADVVARSWAASRFLFIAITINILSSMTVDACSMPRGWRPQSAVEKLLSAQHALYGTVLRTIPDERFAYGGASTAYTAEIEVHCILKGPQSERIVNITQAGYVPGWCQSTNLKVGQRYVVLVHFYDDEYIPNAGELAADTEEQINSLTVACGLQQLYPRGFEADGVSVRCPRIAPESNCKSAKDFGTTPVADVDEDYDTPMKNESLRVGYARSNAGNINTWQCQSTIIHVFLLGVFIALVRNCVDVIV